MRREGQTKQMTMLTKKLDANQFNLKDQVVAINRVTKVVKGGKNMSFAALVVVGDPGAGVVKPHTDYFGNNVTFVTVEGSHKRLVITSRSRVKVVSPSPRQPNATPAWETVRARCVAEKSGECLEACEFIFPSPQIKPQPDFAAYAQPSFTAQRPVLEAVLDLTAGRNISRNLSVSITTLNVTNRHLLTDNSLTFGGVHWNNPFQIYAELRYKFHY